MKNSIVVALAVLGLIVAPAFAQSYCAPASTGLACGIDEYISNITITDASAVVVLNNTSACVAPPAYEDYTATVAPVALVPGATYNVSVTVGQWWSGDQVRLWLDTDQNFSFEDANDTLVTMTGPAANAPSATVTGTFTVPPGTIGGMTRLRVRLVYVTWPVPASCANAGFGNVEDYAAATGATLPPDYQMNGPTAALDFDGVLASAYSGAVSTKCVGGTVLACLNGFGNPCDVFINGAPIVPLSAGGVPFGANIVNLNLAASFMPVFGAWLPLGPGFGTCPLQFPAVPGALSAQLVVIDPTAVGGVALSQASQVNGVVGGALSLVNADDVAYTVDLAAAPICYAAGVNFYGTTYTQISVSTNGIVSPGAIGVTGWTPSAATALTQVGSVGIWSDWQSNANPAASIVVNGSGAFGGVDVTYTNVPYWGSTITSTFNVGIDGLGPRIEGISGLGTDPTGTMIMLSRGSGLATDPGATAFALSALPVVSAAPATDMLYAIGTGTPTLGGGANNLWFTSLPAGGYSWQGL